MEVDNEGECSGGSQPKRLVVPLETSRVEVEQRYTQEHKEEGNGDVDTLPKAPDKYRNIEVLVLLSSDVELRKPVAVVLVHVLQKRRRSVYTSSRVHHIRKCALNRNTAIDFQLH